MIGMELAIKYKDVIGNEHELGIRPFYDSPDGGTFKVTVDGNDLCSIHADYVGRIAILVERKGEGMTGAYEVVELDDGDEVSYLHINLEPNSTEVLEEVC